MTSAYRTTPQRLLSREAVVEQIEAALPTGSYQLELRDHGNELWVRLFSFDQKRSLTRYGNLADFRRKYLLAGRIESFRACLAKEGWKL